MNNTNLVYGKVTSLEYFEGSVRVTFSCGASHSISHREDLSVGDTVGLDSHGGVWFKGENP